MENIHRFIPLASTLISNDIIFSSEKLRLSVSSLFAIVTIESAKELFLIHRPVLDLRGLKSRERARVLGPSEVKAHFLISFIISFAQMMAYQAERDDSYLGSEETWGRRIILAFGLGLCSSFAHIQSVFFKEILTTTSLEESLLRKSYKIIILSVGSVATLALQSFLICALAQELNVFTA